MQGEQHAAAVAGDPDDEDGCEPVAQDSGGDRRGHHDPADHELHGRLEAVDLQPVPLSEKQDDRGQEHQRDHDDTLGEWQRPPLGVAGQVDRDGVRAAQHRVVDPVGVTERGTHKTQPAEFAHQEEQCSACDHCDGRET